MHMCVVMAVHNRIENVRRALQSWALQTRRDFSLVIADDASTDDIQGLVEEYKWAFNLIYVSTGGEKPRTVPVALNMGTKAAPPETTHIWYTDGDIIFHNNAMRAAYDHVRDYSERVIAGRYDWMPPMSFAPRDLEHEFQRFVDCDFPRPDVATSILQRHPDHRTRRHGSNWFKHRLLDACGAVLGANIIIPIQAWHDIKGWDEHIPGANANDCDFGWCLTDAGYTLLTCQCIMGFHQWHLRDKAVLDLYKVSLPYIFRKHGKPVPEQWRAYDTHQESVDA